MQILFNLPRCTQESSGAIKQLQRSINNCISALQLYAIDIRTWDAIFVYLCSTRLPDQSLSLWEQSVSEKTEIPKWSDLDIFLTDRFRTLETVSDLRTSGSGQPPPLSARPSTQPSMTTYLHVSNNECKLCKAAHSLRGCKQFLQMSVPDRFNFVKRHNFCINCLAANHELNNCSSAYTCSKC